MEALCQVVTGERNDFIFHSDNWVKQISGSSAKVLCPHSYPRDLLSNQESLQGGDEADASPSSISVLSCRGAGLEEDSPAWIVACSPVPQKSNPACPGHFPSPEPTKSLPKERMPSLRLAVFYYISSLCNRYV